MSQNAELEEKTRQEMIASWEAVMINSPIFAEKIKREVDGDKGPYQRNYYEGFSRATTVLLPQILYAPVGGQTAAAYMRMYVEWQLNSI